MAGEDFDDDLHYVFENRVRFAETDSQGVVFYGEYVTYQDETFNEFLRRIDYDYDTLEEEGWDVHVVHVDLDYRSSAVFEDRLVSGIRATAVHDSSMDFAYACRKRADGSLVAEGSLTHVAVNPDTGETIRIPDGFRDSVVTYQDVPPDPV